MSTTTTPDPFIADRRHELQCFGTDVTLIRSGPDAADPAIDQATALLREIHATLSRFEPGSELSRLNRDPRALVPASELMQRFARAVRWAGHRSGGLVDATILPELEDSGYRGHFEPGSGRAPLGAGFGERVFLRSVAERPPHGAPARELHGAWNDVFAHEGYVHRPSGVRLDSGGIGKGLAADLAAGVLEGAAGWVVSCGGDLRIGGSSGQPRPVDVLDPTDPEHVLHRLYVTRGGVATSGVLRRSWTSDDGRPAHHLIDPRTGKPADTGIVQVTALAPTTLEAEVLAKTALLTGGHAAATKLTHGGVVVHHDGIVELVPPPRREQQPRAGTRVQLRASGGRVESTGRLALGGDSSGMAA